MLPKSRMQSTQRARERGDVESVRTIGNLVRYSAIMRKDMLRQFFLGQVPVSGLAQDGQCSVERLDAVESNITIEDMQDSFFLERQHVILLCDAALSNKLTSEAVTTVAFALMASDRFEWDDETLSEVLSDWACPQGNFPLNDSTLRMHRTWLTGDAVPPAKPASSDNPFHGHLVSVRRKVSTSSRSVTK
jgi:hypothetical protein